MVEHVQVEPALAPVVRGFHAAHQFVLPVRKNPEADIRPAHDAVEIGSLHVGLEHHLACARKPAVRRGREVPYPAAPAELLAQRIHRLADLRKRIFVLRLPCRSAVQPLYKHTANSSDLVALCLQRSQVVFRSALQLRRQRTLACIQLVYLLFAFGKCICRFFKFTLGAIELLLCFSNLLFGIGLACKRKLFRKFLYRGLARFHIGLEARNLFFKFCRGSLQTIQFPALFRNVLFEECLTLFALFFLGYSLSQRRHLVAVFGIFRIAALAGIFQAALAKKFVH